MQVDIWTRRELGCVADLESWVSNDPRQRKVTYRSVWLLNRFKPIYSLSCNSCDTVYTLDHKPLGLHSRESPLGLKKHSSLQMVGYTTSVHLTTVTACMSPPCTMDPYYQGQTKDRKIQAERERERYRRREKHKDRQTKRQKHNEANLESTTKPVVVKPQLNETHQLIYYPTLKPNIFLCYS